MSSARHLAALALVLACAPHVDPLAGGPPCPTDMKLVPGGTRDGASVAPFCLDTAEVTTRQYGACMAAGRCSPPLVDNGEGCSIIDADGSFYPINCVALEQATAYCAWLGKRLPGDDEWLWAAHGGPRGTAYPWGDDPGDHPRTCTARGSLGTCHGGLYDDSSPEGLRDLVGNVFEWTLAGDRGGLRGGSFRAAPNLGAADPRPDEARIDSGIRCASDPHAAARASPPALDWAPYRTPDESVERLTVPAPRRPPARPLTHLTVLARQPATPTRWSELDGGAFVPFAPADPAAFRLAPAIDRASMPPALADCTPLRGLLSTIVMRCDHERLVAVEREGSKIRWITSARHDSWLGPIAFGPRTFITGDTYESLTGYSLATGRQAWRGPVPPDRMWLDDTRGYLRDERTLTAFDPATGAALWSVPVAPRCRVAFGEGALVIEEPSGYRRVDPASGTALGDLIAPHPACVGADLAYHQEVRPTIAAGRLFNVAEPRGLRALELATGAELWRRTDLESSRFIADHDAIYTTHAGYFLALDAATGETRLEVFVPDLEAIEVHPGAGAHGPLVVARGRNHTLILGRGPAVAVREAYTVRGRISREFLRSNFHLDLGPHQVWVGRDGRFEVRGRGVVGDVLGLTAHLVTPFPAPRGAPLDLGSGAGPVQVVLDGRGTYDLGVLGPRPRE